MASIRTKEDGRRSLPPSAVINPIDDEIGASLKESLYTEVEGEIGVLELTSISSNEPALRSTSNVAMFVCLFVCFESHEQFFSYLATVTITGDGAANSDLICIALTAISSEGSFTCHTYCDTGPPFLRSYPKDL
jgi:hypothetical protein